MTNDHKTETNSLRAYATEKDILQAYATKIKLLSFNKREWRGYNNDLNKVVESLRQKYGFAASIIESVNLPNGTHIIQKIELFGNGKKSLVFDLRA